jgi:glyoxylase-like metal-dependent hydrolase (beta-lactamase superfamily II)
VRPADEWFRVKEVRDGVWLLGEPPHVNTWLVVGSGAAALIDSGMGVRPIRPVVERITDLPVIVLNTHSHFDHIGGNHEFDRVLIHPEGVAQLARDVPSDLLAEYLEYAAEMEKSLPQYIHADRRFFFSLAAADEPRHFPADERSWRIPGVRADGVLEDGYVVDLGDRRLRVVATPGHSPDHVSFVLDPDAVLFAGDAISTGAIYVQWPESDLAAFAGSAARLAALAPEIDTVLVHHWLRYAALPGFLDDVAGGSAATLQGRAVFRDNRDCAGQRVREAVFGEFSLFLPNSHGIDEGMPHAQQ